MGTPLPANEPDELCTTCWGPGKPFGPGPTPHVIIARLTRLLPGFAWDGAHQQLLLISHYLIQQANPCEYRIQDGVFGWFLFFAPAFTQFSVTRNQDGFLAFFHGSDQPCELDFDNEQTGFDDGVAFGGFVNLTWNPEDL